MCINHTGSVVVNNSEEELQSKLEKMEEENRVLG